MTEETQNNQAPHISVLSQYLKDISFENPSAPKGLIKLDEAPKIDLALDLKINNMEEDQNCYEVEMILNVEAKSKDTTLFIVDMKYAGIFQLINVPEEQKPMILAIHCPSIIFPYARKIVGDTTQHGGFQPLMIDPVDFSMLYAKKMKENQQN